MNQIFKFENYNINILGTQEKPLFFASQVAHLLGYSNTQKAVYTHIWDINKTNVLKYNQQFLPTQNGVLQNLNHQTILINEMGMYQLIFNSKLEKPSSFNNGCYLLFYQAFVKPVHFNQKCDTINM